MRSQPANCDGVPEVCDGACEDGDAVSCFSQGYRFEHNPKAYARAQEECARACAPRLANACTNLHSTYGAGSDALGTRVRADAARDTYRARDAFACGIVGRLALERAAFPEDVAYPHRNLERNGDEIGGFSVSPRETLQRRRFGESTKPLA